jgi:hypothetical protein
MPGSSKARAPSPLPFADNKRRQCCCDLPLLRGPPSSVWTAKCAEQGRWRRLPYPGTSAARWPPCQPDSARPRCVACGPEANAHAAVKGDQGAHRMWRRGRDEGGGWGKRNNGPGVPSREGPCSTWWKVCVIPGLAHNWDHACTRKRRMAPVPAAGGKGRCGPHHTPSPCPPHLHQLRPELYAASRLGHDVQKGLL